ncbi:MAG TPA: hypothetical protein VFQ77_00135 [Pseudonocardiaceae bacterium]|jgi:hypothetical protein|nr:hypothetical protein [Pseudonocardiaceae bacterium]
MPDEEPPPGERVGIELFAGGDVTQPPAPEEDYGEASVQVVVTLDRQG